MRSRQKDAEMPEAGASLLRSRYLLAGWSFAAVLFGVVGVSAVHFAPTPDIERNSRTFAGLPLPLGGTDRVGPTGSIVADDETVTMGVMPSAGGMANAEAMRLMEAQVDTLRRELVALRRRSEMLAEQNRAQSDRIAALEKSGAVPAEAERTPRPGVPQSQPDANAPGVPKPEQKVSAVPAPRPVPVETMPAPETRAGIEPPVVAVPVRGNPEAMTAEPVKVARAPATPVRIVDLPKSGAAEPVATGSIPQTEASPQALTRDLAAAMVIRPADPSGRTLGSSTVIGRSDFAIEIGRYASRAEADAAWTGFRDTHQDRMADLRALTVPVEGADGVRLLAGPFANAALAAVACLRLSEDGSTGCRPTFFVGEPLDDQ